MEPFNLQLLDGGGEPVENRVEQVLKRLLPRFQRAFPALCDESALTDAFEEAARRITHRQIAGEDIQDLHRYAWVTLRRIGITRSRRGPGRIDGCTLESERSAVVLDGMPARSNTIDDIERTILLKEILGRLTPQERRVCIWKKAGFTSQEIAARSGTTEGAINTLFARTRQKILDGINAPAAELELRQKRPGRTTRTRTGGVEDRDD